MAKHRTTKRPKRGTAAARKLLRNRKVRRGSRAWAAYVKPSTVKRLKAARKHRSTGGYRGRMFPAYSRAKVTEVTLLANGKIGCPACGRPKGSTHWGGCVRSEAGLKHGRGSLANPAWHKHKLAEAKHTFKAEHAAHVKAGYCSAMQGARFCWGSPGHRGEHHFRYNDPMFD